MFQRGLAVTSFKASREGDTQSNQASIMVVSAVLDSIVGWFQHLGPVVEKTVFLKMPGLDPLLTPLGESLGFELGMLKV